MESSTSSERTKRFIQKYGIMAIIMTSLWDCFQRLARGEGRDGTKQMKQKYGRGGCLFL
ncbi:MAG TPA: hypothetical protein PLW09_08770 [Candidatus Kapabacteria bacterium]|nr:hypothetical protein [Candidatus Kapabacteria bacterium]